MADHRTLVLMRHGKSSYPEGIRDHERPLAERGLREARIGGEWIRENVPPVDAVLCSTSRRTVETLASTGIEAPAGSRSPSTAAHPQTSLQLREPRPTTSRRS